NTPEGVGQLLEEMDRTGLMGIVDGPGLALVEPRRDSLQAGFDRLPPEVHDLDATKFDLMLGRMSMSTDLPGLDYRHDAYTVASMVAKGAVDMAFLLRPVSVAQIAEVAAVGQRMPQKTTFFRPKPLTGLVFRSLDRG